MSPVVNFWMDSSSINVLKSKAQNGEALTADMLTKEYYELNKKYFGENVAIDEDLSLPDGKYTTPGE